MDDRVNAQWEHTRLIVYTIAMTVTDEKDRQEIYDFLPLPGDPTPEQRQQRIREWQEEAAERQRMFNESLRMEMQKEKNGR